MLLYRSGIEKGKPVFSLAGRFGSNASGYQAGPSEVPSYPVEGRRTAMYHSLKSCTLRPVSRMPEECANSIVSISTWATGSGASMINWNATNSLRAAFRETVFDEAFQTLLEER